MKTATEVRIDAHTDEMAVRRTADSILHLLRDFIPRECFRDAWDRVAETAFQEGWELTNKAMRKEYEAWKATQLEFLNTAPLGFRNQDATQNQDPKVVGYPPAK